MSSLDRGPIRIVGAGLSGLHTAIQLARLGIGTEIYERQRGPRPVREVRCDAVENWSGVDDFKTFLSSWAIDPALFRRASSVEVRTFDGECHAVAQSTPLLYLVKRGSGAGCLDHALTRQALELGVPIHWGQTLPPEQADVWAVGSRRRGFFLDVGITFRTSQPDRIVILFDRGLTPKACAYLIVVDGVATLAVLLTEQFKRAKALLSETVAAFQRIQPFDMRDVRMGSGFGGAVNAFLSGPSTPLAIGEAAGFLDYLWGFGIRHAMHSGALAAHAIACNEDYDGLVDREIRPLVRSSLINRAFYDFAGNRAYRMLIRHICPRHDVRRVLHRTTRSRKMRALFWPLVSRAL